MSTPPPNPHRPPANNSITKETSSASPDGENGQPAWLRARPWATFVVPFAVYMLVGMLEPGPDKPFELLGLTIPYAAYPLVYTIKIALTMAAMLAVWPGYRQFAWRVSPLAFVLGAVGVVAWIGLCKLEIERRVLSGVGLGALLDLGTRSAFNPWEHWPEGPLLAGSFLAVRFWGLAFVVPIIEEFFLRGFVMRFVIDPDWWKVPFGKLTPLAVAVGTLVPVLMHPVEILAAAVWFTAVTWLMFKTRNIWDCVVAHAVTNLLLGVWVVYSGDWFFL